MANVVSDRPFASLAVICDRVLHEQDSNSYSVIRIVNRLILFGFDLQVPLVFAPVPVQFSALLCFQPGAVGRTYNVSVRAAASRGLVFHPIAVEMSFPSPETSVFIPLVPFAFDVTQLGRYSFEVLVDGEVFTRMPLSVEYRLAGNESAPNQTPAAVTARATPPPTPIQEDTR